MSIINKYYFTTIHSKWVIFSYNICHKVVKSPFCILIEIYFSQRKSKSFNEHQICMFLISYDVSFFYRKNNIYLLILIAVLSCIVL